MKIENTREIFFNNSKEQYLYFKDVWSKACNSDEFHLTREHFLFYALITGKDVRKAFTPTTNENKLNNGAYINHGLYFAYQDLKFIANAAHRYVQQVEKGSNTWFIKNKDGKKLPPCVEAFLKPFDGTITPETILAVYQHCPKIEPIESSYGEGMRIARELLAKDRRQITAEELWECIA